MKKDIINKIVNQVNSLNKKIKKFQLEGISDHENFIRSMFNDNQMQYKEYDEGTIKSLSKAKKGFYEKQNILQLKKTLNTLIKINNHDYFGTVNKYKSLYNEQRDNLINTVKNILEKKGYSISDINMIINSENFLNTLTHWFKSEKNLASDQIVEKVFLNYVSPSLNDEEMYKRTTDLEKSVNTRNQINRDTEILRKMRG